jgi:late competence protein required for DNA uptake (superfamily II DNA/RNA helicase)
MVTQRENILRGETSVVALNARKTHCKRGHAFTEENTILNKIGSRNCRICIRDWDSRIEQKEKRRLWAIEYHKTDRWKEYRKQYYASKKKV